MKNYRSTGDNELLLTEKTLLFCFSQKEDIADAQVIMQRKEDQEMHAFAS